MLAMKSTCALITTLLFQSVAILGVHGHVAAWSPAMYCFDGNTGTANLNTEDAVAPLYQLPKSQWWFHHVNNCDQFPPAPGTFLELPANGQFTVELATNRGFTSLSFNGKYAGEYTGGANTPGYVFKSQNGQQVPQCISEPNIHAQNESRAAGTAFAISYTSNLNQVTPENLVVFSVLYNSPWKRLATYQVPNLPACPSDGCICAWGWVPNGCGIANIYMEGFRCKVTGTPGSVPVGTPKPPTWCEEDPQNCTQGPKQMVFWHQAEGDNIEVSGSDLSGEPKSPGYNQKCGFKNGAQTDIFVNSPQADTKDATPVVQPNVTPKQQPTGSSARQPTTSPNQKLQKKQCAARNISKRHARRWALFK